MIRLTGDNHHVRRNPGGSPDAESDDDSAPLDLMEVFAAALLIIDENLQILRSNAKARDYLATGGADGFSRLLGTSMAQQSQELRRQVREAVVKGVRSALLLRPATPQSLICSVLPIPSRTAPCALVALTPLSGGSKEVVPYLRSLYKLSNAEAEIAAAAAGGMDVVQLAHSRKVSIHTLRAQIAAIKAKMGLSRMTEIAVTIGRIEAAVTWL